MFSYADLAVAIEGRRDGQSPLGAELDYLLVVLDEETAGGPERYRAEHLLLATITLEQSRTRDTIPDETALLRAWYLYSRFQRLPSRGSGSAPRYRLERAVSLAIARALTQLLGSNYRALVATLGTTPFRLVRTRRFSNPPESLAKALGLSTTRHWTER